MNKEETQKNTLHDELNSQEVDARPIEDKIAELARQLLVSSQVYKQARMNQIAMYERLYNNDIPPKLRQMFNVPIPVFSGMIDSLLAQFNDEMKLKFKATNPAQYLVLPKVQAHWEHERDSMTPNAMWNYKARQGRFNAMLSGRYILEEYAMNDPEYKNVLNVINYSDFHCDPLGGGLLENHSFAGKEGCFRSKFDLLNSNKYDEKQVDKLVKYGWSDAMFTNLETSYGTRFTRWKALGLDPITNSFKGEPTYNLCDFIVTYNGVRYNVVFEPCSGVWLYCKPWKETKKSGRYPWHSAATHEDDKNFWSKSYADDFFPISDSIITMFNQELTNREKKNFNSRAFDKDMFTDVAKLDAAQYRPDTLVPANTMGGAKNIASGIYTFETAELKGTVDLIQWMSSYTGEKTGADELPKGGSNRVSVVIAQQQKQSKRIGLRSDSFKECDAQLGMTYLEGLVEYMPAKVSVIVTGENGFVEEQELNRIDLSRAGLLGVSVGSTAEQEQADAMKKDGKVKAIEMVTQNPNLTKYEKETIYREVGQFDENEIALLLDTKGEISKKQIAHASQNIQDILENKEPDVYYGADNAYLEYLDSWITDHKGHVRGKEDRFARLMEQMAPIIEQNTMRKAKKLGQQQGQQQGAQGQPPQQGQPQMGKLSMQGVADRMAGSSNQ